MDGICTRTDFGEGMASPQTASRDDFVGIMQVCCRITYLPSFLTDTQLDDYTRLNRIRHIFVGC